MNNPLFTDKKDKNLETISQSRSLSKSTATQESNNDPALSYVRQKISNLFATEPKAQIAMQEAEIIQPRSKHQQFMYDLSQSGKSIVEIQTAWHNYYFSLPDEEKHEVWREFYESNARLQTTHDQKLNTQSNVPASMTSAQTSAKATAPQSRAGYIERLRFGLPINTDLRTVGLVKQQIIQRLANRPKVSIKQNLKSLVFGLSLAVVVIFIALFSFFNQIIITPFIQPGRHITALPLIINASTAGSYTSPEVIIPKINVEIPVDYSLTTDDESVIEDALENGVVHYPSTVLPGQDGNAAYFGHSSNNILNPGKYKFAFVLLHELVSGDTFYLTYSGQVYIYQVISRQIVSPSDVAVLGDVSGQSATATLITCDPPGTSLHRLVVIGKQISPDPNANTTATAQAVAQPKELASNGPSLWSRLWHDVF
jgi:LPXTG-site transpeptidase (sortase) family protein